MGAGRAATRGDGEVIERLAIDAPDMRRPGADLIAHYLNPDRLPVDQRWPRKHAHTQRRLCERFAAPLIATVTCQDIKAEIESEPDEITAQLLNEIMHSNRRL